MTGSLTTMTAVSIIACLCAPTNSLPPSQSAFFTVRPTTNPGMGCMHNRNNINSSLLRRKTAIFFQEEEQNHSPMPEKNTSLQAFNSIENSEKSPLAAKQSEDMLNSVKASISSFVKTSKGGPPPMQIEDFPLLFYDIFLILNLSVSISFWVVHRMSFTDILPAFSEGSLLSILWVIAGLWNGAFLYSAADGHYDMTKEENQDKGGPVSAAMLGLSTFVGTANLRILVALSIAILEHRKVGITNGEDLIPLEIAFGLMLMSAWRMLHSSYTRV